MKLKPLLSAVLLSISIAALADPIEEGKAIFISRCAGCHNINKATVGPALAGVDERRSIDWIVKFVQSSQALVKSGDKDASALFAKFNNMPMPDHRDLTADKIKSVVEYIKSQSTTAASSETVAVPKTGKTPSLFIPVTAADYWLFGALLFCIVLLILSILFLVKVKAYQRKLAREK